MPNFPFGDAFIVQTPALQRVSNQLYQEQQKREAQGYNDYLATQQALQKEFANVRQADVPEVIDSYQKFKAARQSLLFDPSVHRNPKLYAQKQQEANQAEANLRSQINGSIQLKTQFDELSKNRLANPDNFEDNAGTLMVQDMNVPTSKLTQAGWTPDRYMYAGVNYNLGDAIKNATGTKGQIYTPEVLSKDGLSYEQKGFTVANNPLQFHEILAHNITTHKADKTAALEYKQYTPEQLQTVQDKFLSLPDEYFAGYGIAPKDIPTYKEQLNQDNGKSNAEKWSILQSQLYALSNPPQIADTKTRDNRGAILNAQLQNEKIMEGLRQGNKIALAKLHEQYKRADKASQESFVDGYIQQLKDYAMKNGSRQYKHANGQTETQYSFEPPFDMKKQFEKLNAQGYMVKPDEIRFLTNGDVLPVYYKQQVKDGVLSVAKDKHGNVGVDMGLTKPMPESTLKLMISKQFATPQVNMAMGGDNGGETTEEESYDLTVPVQPQQQSGGYTNLTETNKGTIGVKNGKWYDVKTGKPIE